MKKKIAKKKITQKIISSLLGEIKIEENETKYDVFTCNIIILPV
jgi:hypothetical protein